MRSPALLLTCAALLAGCGSDDPKKPAAPSPQGGDAAPKLLAGGVPGFTARLKRAKGRTPVVVNKWASWCPPCRAEFPFFRRQAEKRRGRVDFLGVDSDDHDGDARAFLRENPVPYPSYSDPKSEVAAVFKAVQAFPDTAFYDRRGGLAFVHQGGYTSEAKLAADIDRYAR